MELEEAQIAFSQDYWSHFSGDESSSRKGGRSGICSMSNCSHSGLTHGEGGGSSRSIAKKEKQKNRELFNDDEDAEVIGMKIETWWPKEKRWFSGVVTAYDSR